MVATLDTPQLTELFWNSETGRELLAKSRAETLACRREAAASIEANNRALDKSLPKAEAAYAAADDRYQNAVKALQAAEEARRVAYNERHNLLHRTETANRVHEQLLKRTADPAIQELAREVSRAHGQDLAAPAAYRSDAALTAIAEQIRADQLAALQELDELHREPLDSKQLNTRLNSIRAKALRTIPNQAI